MRRGEERSDFRGEHRGDRDRGEKRGFQKRKGCRFCAEPAIVVDYKDRYLLQPFITERCKIVPRRISGNCASHQREVTLAIKRSRHIAVLAYTTAQWQ